jgi:hypothetical protein
MKPRVLTGLHGVLAASVAFRWNYTKEVKGELGRLPTLTYLRSPLTTSWFQHQPDLDDRVEHDLSTGFQSRPNIIKLERRYW